MDNPNINVTQHVGEVKEGGTVIGVQVVYQGEPVMIPSLEDIQFHRAELAKIETYNRWVDEFYIHEEGKVLPLFASPYDDDGGRKREDLLQTIRSHQRLLVLGEPGMGKTVALERMVWETAKADEVVLPILVQLLYFQGLDLIELIRVALNETRRLTFDNAKSVRAFLRETKCMILFDGLNETPGKQREQVIGAIANFMREYPEHRYVVTSRSQDELWRKLRSAELINDAVVVQTISDAQAQGYLQAHLGKEKGATLYDRLDASLKSLARTPLLLKLIKDAGGGSDQLPRNRGELFDKYVMNKLLEREQKLELVETPEVKKKALAHLAFSLQLNHQLACDREWAEKVLAEKGLGTKTDAILKEALLHGLLIQQMLPDKQLLRFSHQSLQEYFVALMLLSEVEVEKNASIIQSALRSLSKHNLTAWVKDAWWSESFVQLAGLLDDADWLARRIVYANPWLAWWCVQEGRDVLVNTRKRIESRSIKLLHSENVTERRKASQTLAQIKTPRVLTPLLFAAGDEDEEVAGFGLHALEENQDAIRPLIRKALHSNDKRSWLAALRYLRNILPDLLWADIPSQMLDEILEVSDKRNYVRVVARTNYDWSAQKIFYCVGDKDIKLVNEAMQVLMKQEDAVRPLIKQALHNNNKRNWLAALRFLRKIPSDLLWADIPDQMLDEILEISDLKNYIQVIAELNNDWSLQRIFYYAGDQNEVVANYAMQVLVKKGEPARVLIKNALHGKDRHALYVSLRCIGVQSDPLFHEEISWSNLLGQPMNWIPAGAFLMGSDKSKDPKVMDNELPQHLITLPVYWIGRFPVTVAQWKIFVGDSGYQVDNKSLQDPDNYPVRYVSWNDALAYCEWLSDKSRLPVTLPSEAEWEKAARGTDGRIYPWGNKFDKNNCNTCESGINNTTPVEKYFPAGDSPYGCVDMAGNVCEWTRSKFKPYPYNTEDGRENLSGDDSRVVRSGSWDFGYVVARTVYRNCSSPNLRDYSCGFRIVVRPYSS